MACMAPASGSGDETTKTMVTTSTGYCFSDVSAMGGGNLIQQQPQQVVVNQQFQSHNNNNFDYNPHEMYGLTSGMELLGFPQKNLHQQQAAAVATDTNSVIWKEFFGKSSTSAHIPSTSKATPINEQEFYHQDFTTTSESLMGTNETWHHQHQDNNINNNRGDHHVQFLDDPSCVFPTSCDDQLGQGGIRGNERPSQGLSLSLGSSHPSRIASTLQSLGSSDGYFGKSTSTIQHQQQQQQLMQQGRGGGGGNIHFHQNHQFHIRSSKYLAPAQELLNDFCNLGTKQQQLDSTNTQKFKIHKTNQIQSPPHQQDDATANPITSSRLYTTDLLELQKRKSKLLQMLEEVDRRYKHYCDQMKAVVSSFEAVAGNGAAMVYSTLASKAMSRHFRSLRDGIIGQIKATKKALGEKDTTTTPGGTRGETPRLRVLDQTLRQQRAFQQMTMMETHPWRPQRGLPERAVSVLRAWLFEHFLHPYPSEVDKHILSRQTGLSRSQVSNWFINARVRLWKPMVEEMYVEETKEQENMVGTTSSSDINNIHDGVAGDGRQQQNHQTTLSLPLAPPSEMVADDDVDEDDQKPTHEQLVRIDSECLSSIIHNPAAAVHDDDVVQHLQQQQQMHHHHHHHHNSFGNAFGAVELDFSSSYNHNYGNRGGGIGGGGGGNVSLTLGLQQHGGSGGGGLAFSPGTGNQGNSNNLYYSTREHNIESCPSISGGVQYSSLLETEISQNLPYRNLMGAQLLHDLAG